MLLALLHLSAATAALASQPVDRDDPPKPAASASAPRPAPAEKDDDDDEEGRAPATAIVVTGQRLDAARARIEPALGASTYSLSNDAIEARPGGETRSLGSVLVQMPGVAASGAKRLTIRGASGVQYRLNNVILPDGMADFGETLSARLADRTELITGALPAQYGLVSGGIVNITTKSGLYAHGGQVELYGGAHRSLEPAIEWGGARGGSSLFASGSLRRTDRGLDPVSRARPLHDRARELEGFAFADQVIDDDSRISLILGTSNEHNQIPALAVAGVAGSAGRLGSLSAGNHYAIATFQHADGGTTLQVSLSGLLSRQQVSPDAPLALAVDHVARSLDEKRHSIATQAEAAFDVGARNVVRSGLLATFDNGHRQETRLTPLRTSQSDRVIDRNSFGAFVEDEFRPTTALTLNAGLRLDRVSHAGAHVGPRANLAWTAARGLLLHAGYARYFVAPPVDELTTTADRPRGETDDYVDVGVEKSWGDFRLGIDAYHRAARNLLAERLWTSAPIGEAFNYRRATLRGVELLMTYADGPVTAWGNVALARTSARGISAGLREFTPAELAFLTDHRVRIDQDQAVTASAGGSYRLGKLLLSGAMTYGSGMRRSAPGLLNGERLRAAATLDLAAVYRLRLLEAPTELRLDARNLFNRRVALSDGTAIGAGAPRWNEGRGLFVGIEQGF